MLEADSEDAEADVITVGKYKFRKKVFEWGRIVLKEASAQNHTYLIIDEIGTLSLKVRIFHLLLMKYFTYSPKILLVVRESLVGKFLDHYMLELEHIEFFEID